MASARTTTNHEQIRRWVEERGGKPACVSQTRGRGQGCLLRIDFPGFSGEETLDEISWEEFFQVFDDNDLAFLYQESVEGKTSRFNRLVERETAS